MGDIKGFLKFGRKESEYRPVCERIKDYAEVALLPKETHSQEQASRCMDCGTPFCHWACPIANYIPEWNDLVFAKQWEKALQLLDATNNLPEVTGRVCPAPCEYSCVLGINNEPVTIRENELAIIEYGFKNNLLKSQMPKKRTGKRIAVIGSGPSGLACSAQLNRAGHTVVVFEKDDAIGGILRYGIPDFKLEKWILERRIALWKKEGVRFETNVTVGKDYSVAKLLKDFDALCLAIGSRIPRDLNIAGRNLKGIYFAMDFLVEANRRVRNEKIPPEQLIAVKGKRVVVIGGGDTGADCVGVSHRQGAARVVQIEIMPKPPQCRTEDYPWPKYPLLLKTSSSHEEGGQRHWAVLTKRFIGEKGRVKKLSCLKVEFSKRDEKGCPLMQEVPHSQFEIDADVVILALGFIGPEKSDLLKELDIAFDERGNIKTNQNYMTSHKGVFSCGDSRRGQSLIVWALTEGRTAAHLIDAYLMGR